MDPSRPRETPALCWGIPALVLVLAGGVLIVLVSVDHAAGRLALGFLSVPIRGLMVAGHWLALLFWNHPLKAGLAVFGLTFVMAVAHLITGRLSALPAGLLFLALGSAATAQGLIMADRIRTGLLVHAASFVLAFIAGLWRVKKSETPKELTPGSEMGDGEAPESRPASRPKGFLDIVLVISISLLAALGLAGIAQGLIVANRVRTSIWVFAISFVLALIVGLWRGRKPKTGKTPAPESTIEDTAKGPSEAEPPPRPRNRIEVVVVIVICLLALICRLYAINEIPSYFDDEMVGSMIQSASLTGVRSFMVDGPFLGNSVGAYHVFFMWILHKFFGASLLMVRLAAALPGILTVPIFYAFLRNLKG